MGDSIVLYLPWEFCWRLICQKTFSWLRLVGSSSTYKVSTLSVVGLLLLINDGYTFWHELSFLGGCQVVKGNRKKHIMILISSNFSLKLHWFCQRISNGFRFLRLLSLQVKISKIDQFFDEEIVTPKWSTITSFNCYWYSRTTGRVRLHPGHRYFAASRYFKCTQGVWGDVLP